VTLLSLWIGPRLGRVERACLRSALRQGHKVHLYCYRPPEGVPRGVELRDAAALFPESAIVRHHGGSPSLFSNRFRYEAQRRGLGTWIDCDLYLLRPIDLAAPVLFGEEAPGWINGGILRLPPDAPVLAPLLELFEERTVPFWLPPRARLAARLRRRLTGRTGLARMPWGTAGPKALTALLAAHGLAGAALPRDIFYPVRWQDAAWILAPGVALEEVVTERSVAVHLWNERIRAFKDRPAPAGSFLARLQAEGA
jgi:hypothetical protein